MMKKITFAIPLLLWMGGVLHAQKMTVKQFKAQQEKVMRLAAKYGDVPVYKQALYQLMALEPDNNGWKDSLAILYFRTGNYPQSILLTGELLKSRPGDTTLLQMQAQSYEALGDLKKAVERYDKIFAQNPKNILIGYRLAWNQYLLKRTEEAYQTLMKLKKLDFPEKLEVTVPAGDKKMQKVPFKAAYYNLLGLVTYDLHNWKLAISHFDQALKVFPGFVSAKQNKNALELMVRKLESKPAGSQTQTKQSSK